MKIHGQRNMRFVTFVLCQLIAIMFLGSCSPLKKLTVLASMEPDRELYFQNTILLGYEKKTAIKVRVIEYRNPDSIEMYIKRYNGKINLVELPYEKSAKLASGGLFKPLDSFLTIDEIRNFNDSYLLGSFGMVASRPTLIPRSMETPVLIYSKSHVADALKLWPEMKTLVNDIVKKYNGTGLPEGYKLEANPDLWDYYDIAVAGLIWTNDIREKTHMPRVAHVAVKNRELSIFIQDGIFQCNGDTGSILGCRGDAVSDFFQWEAMFVSSGVYNSKMWNEGWGRRELMEKFANEEIYLTVLTTDDCFRLHGTGHAERKGMLKTPGDCGVAILPLACSMDLDDAGYPLRTGRRSVQTRSSWWAIPYNSSSALQSYRLAISVSDSSRHGAECSRFGLVPVRKEIVNELPVHFRNQWSCMAVEHGLAQIVQNGEIMANDNLQHENMTDLYVNLWFDIIAGHDWAAKGDPVPDRKYLTKIIQDKFRAAAKLTGKENAAETSDSF